MNYRRGDVVIALFPNADGTGAKPRPVLVVQSDSYNLKIHNVVVAAITTNLAHASDPASYLVEVTTKDGQISGLIQNSVVSCINLATIAESFIAKKTGYLVPAIMRQISNCLKTALAIP